MRQSSRTRSIVEGGISLFPLAFLAVFWTMRSTTFSRYHRIVGEDGPLETFQFFFYLVSGLLSAWIARRFFKAGRRAPGAVFLLLTAALLFSALEEISWGQRVFSRDSPEYFLDHNIQGETNIHNLTTFQPFLHGAYLAAGTTLVILCLLPGASLGRKLRLPLPDRGLVFYFLPLVAFYGWFEFRRLAHDTLIYAYDQELAEFLLALGLLLFVSRVLVKNG